MMDSKHGGNGMVPYHTIPLVLYHHKVADDERFKDKASMERNLLFQRAEYGNIHAVTKLTWASYVLACGCLCC